MGGQDETASAAYSERLSALSRARWKRILDVQRPYRWNLRRLIGNRRTLDVGCGIGRNLVNLPPGSLGVDHNEQSVAICRNRGLPAMTSEEFLARSVGEYDQFDALLAAHLIEHLAEGTGAELLRPYLAHLAPGARVVLICPQERGFASDETHTVFIDHGRLEALCKDVGLSVQQEFSFPFPRIAGRLFTYNEFVTVASAPIAP